MKNYRLFVILCLIYGDYISRDPSIGQPYLLLTFLIYFLSAYLNSKTIKSDDIISNDLEVESKKGKILKYFLLGSQIDLSDKKESSDKRIKRIFSKALIRSRFIFSFIIIAINIKVYFELGEGVSFVYLLLPLLCSLIIINAISLAHFQFVLYINLLLVLFNSGDIRALNLIVYLVSVVSVLVFLSSEKKISSRRINSKVMENMITVSVVFFVILFLVDLGLPDSKGPISEENIKSSMININKIANIIQQNLPEQINESFSTKNNKSCGQSNITKKLNGKLDSLVDKIDSNNYTQNELKKYGDDVLKEIKEVQGQSAEGRDKTENINKLMSQLNDLQKVKSSQVSTRAGSPDFSQSGAVNQKLQTGQKLSQVSINNLKSTISEIKKEISNSNSKSSNKTLPYDKEKKNNNNYKNSKLRDKDVISEAFTAKQNSEAKIKSKPKEFIPKIKLEMFAKMIYKLLKMIGVIFIVLLVIGILKRNSNKNKKIKTKVVLDKLVIQKYKQQLKEIDNQSLSGSEMVVKLYNVFVDLIKEVNYMDQEVPPPNNLKDYLIDEYASYEGKINFVVDQFCDVFYGNKNIDVKDFKQYRRFIMPLFYIYL